ncbi:DNA replication/repair protein RecF, partial [candidate division KSB1 bacterium]
MFPTVILSPESQGISQGFPEERRKFIDLTISMVEKEYLYNLIAYKRIIKQRNRILSENANGNLSSKKEVEPWDEQLIKYGSAIIRRRFEVIETFSGICSEMYSEISGGKEELSVEYRSTIPVKGDLEDSYRREIEKNRNEDIRKGITVSGPHRDEIVFRLNSKNAKKYGSQGQHKTILLALKSAELRFISEKKGMDPVILLDDLFALLDKKRILSFLRILKNYGQYFVTANREIRPETLMSEAGFSKDDFLQMYVREGKITLRQ